PNEQALRIATIISAQVAGVENELGSIEEGKIADLILVNGNPLENITDIRKVDVTIKDGILYDSEKLYNSVGVKHYR
ncbi:MAG: amidohydrolase family protein, partial [Ekhidna sp.]